MHPITLNEKIRYLHQRKTAGHKAAAMKDRVNLQEAAGMSNPYGIDDY